MSDRWPEPVNWKMMGAHRTFTLLRPFGSCLAPHVGSLRTGGFLDKTSGNQSDLLTTLLACVGVPLDRPSGIATKEISEIRA